MSVIFLLIGISIVVATAFLMAFLWAVRSGQYEDDYTPSVRILFESSVSTKERDKVPNTKSKEEKLAKPKSKP